MPARPVLSTSVLVLVLTALAVRAEIPLPDVTVYGRLRGANDAPVTSGSIAGIVRRGGVEVLRADGEFIADQGTTYYVVRVPMETAIGAPGPSGTGGHDGDTLQLVFGAAEESVALDDPLPRLAAGLAIEADGRVSVKGGGDEPAFVRGDCNADFGFDISDASSLLLYLFLGGLEPPCLRACDANKDDGTDLSDAVYMLAHLFLGGPPLPEPTGACALDPQPSDAVSCLEPVCP